MTLTLTLSNTPTRASVDQTMAKHRPLVDEPSNTTQIHQETSLYVFLYLGLERMSSQ